MNEPQLPAEIEQRFDKEFGYLSVAIDYYVENAYPLRKESGMKHLKDIKHFLATALEEEREKVLSEVEKMKKTDKFPQSLTTYDGKTKYFDRLSDGDLHYNQAISDVLNQLKGKK